MASKIARPLAHYAAWKRAGDFVFLSGVIPVDPARDLIINGYRDLPAPARKLLGETKEYSVDAKEGPIIAQSWFVLDRIGSTVKSAGGSLRDVVKLVQYFRDLRDFPCYSRVRKLFFPEDPPVSTVVEVSGMLPAPTILIEVEATVYLPR